MCTFGSRFVELVMGKKYGIEILYMEITVLIFDQQYIS